MYKRFIFLILSLVLLLGCEKAANFKHGIVYKESGRFAGWPANNGIWSWGDEIVVGFQLGYFKIKTGHAIDPDKPRAPRFARSLDGGETWTIEIPSFLDENGKEQEAIECPGNFDFTHPNFAMRLLMGRFYISIDRCKTWQGPFKLPDFDRKAILARTDYIVNGKHDLMAFMAAAKDDGREGWPFCTRTQDGGKTWEFVSWIGPQPTDGGYAIMPTTVRTSDTGLLTMIRRKAVEGEKRTYWIEAFTDGPLGLRVWVVLLPLIGAGLASIAPFGRRMVSGD